MMSSKQQDDDASVVHPVTQIFPHLSNPRNSRRTAASYDDDILPMMSSKQQAHSSAVATASSSSDRTSGRPRVLRSTTRRPMEASRQVSAMMNSDTDRHDMSAMAAAAGGHADDVDVDDEVGVVELLLLRDERQQPARGGGLLRHTATLLPHYTNYTRLPPSPCSRGALARSL